MAAFLKNRRNQVIIAIFVFALLVLLFFLLVVIRPKTTARPIGDLTPAPTATPSPDVSPTPSESPSPSASAAATASSTAAAPPTAPPSPTGCPGPTTFASGSVLQGGCAPDDASSSACPGTCFGGNGGPPGGCHTGGLNWHHTGWTQDDCDIVLVGSSADTSMAWVTEHKDLSGGGRATRVSLMTPSSAGPWQTVLWAMDESGGGRWTALGVKSGDISGDGTAEIVVGFRMVGTAHTLALDAVRRTGTAMPSAFYHSDLTMGRATVGGGHLTEYRQDDATHGTRFVDSCSSASCDRGTGTPVPWTDTSPPNEFP